MSLTTEHFRCPVCGYQSEPEQEDPGQVRILLADLKHMISHLHKKRAPRQNPSQNA